MMRMRLAPMREFEIFTTTFKCLLGTFYDEYLDILYVYVFYFIHENGGEISKP